MDSDDFNKNSLLSTDQVNSTEIIPQDDDHRKLIDRYFGPMKEGSLRGSIFALLASAMGTGVFNLPLRT